MKTGLIYLFTLVSIITHAQQQPRLVLPVGHVNGIKCVAFSHNGKLAATSSVDNIIKIWNVELGKEVISLSGHTQTVWSAVFSKDDRYILSASADSTVILWDLYKGAKVKIFRNHSSPIWFAQFSPNGKYFISACNNGTCHFWDIGNGKKIKEIGYKGLEMFFCEFSPDGESIITANGDSTATIWDLKTSKKKKTFRGHSANVWSALFNKNGKLVLTASADKTTRVWDAETGNEIFVLNAGLKSVNYACFTPDESQIITASEDDTIRVYDVEKRILIKKFNGHLDGINSIDVSFDQKKIISGSDDGTAYIWDMSTGSPVQILQGHLSFNSNNHFSILNKENKYFKNQSFLFLINEKYRIQIDSFDNTRFYINNKLNHTEVIHFEGHVDKINSISMDRGFNYVISTSDDETARLWDVHTGNELKMFIGHKKPVEKAVFIENDSIIITQSRDNTMRYWNTYSAKTLFVRSGVMNGRLISDINLKDSVAISISLDSTYRISAINNPIKYSEFKSKAGALFHGSFNPLYEEVALASEDGTVRVTNFNTNITRLNLINHTKPVVYVKYNSDGKIILSSGLDKTLCLWDSYSGRLINKIENFAEPVIFALFTDYNQIVAIDCNNNVYLLNLLNPHPIKIYTFLCDYIVSVELLNNDKYLLVKDIYDKNLILNLNNTEQLYTRLQLENDEWLIYDEDYHFDGTPGAIEKLYFTCGLEVIDLGQLKDSLWIPGLAEKIMDNQPLLINDKPAPKLSNLNICDLTPVIEPLEPDKDSKKLRFRITPRNGGLGATEVYINNNLTYTYQPNQLEQQTENKKKVYYLNLHTDTLKGYLSGNRHTPNPLLVKSKVKGSGIYSRGVEVTISNDLDKEESPAFYGVFVGVNDYGNSDGANENKYRNLKMAAKDAEDLASAVEATARNLFKDSTHIYRITGNNSQLPTREVLQKTLDEIGKKAKASDVLYIFFAGHGDIKQLKGEEQIRFMLYRADKINPETSSFGVHDLMEWCRPSNIKAQKRVFVFDACHSGKFSQEFAFGRGDDDGARIRQLDKLKDKNGMMILAASAENESAYEDETLNQGVLTYNLLQVMQTQKKDSSLIVRDWFDETIKLVEEYSRANGNRQHPNSFGDGRFEIGNINEQVRKTIQITAPKIRIGECVLFASDDLSEKEYPGLEEKLNAVFRNTTRGDGFVYSELKSKSYSIKGTYTSSKKQFNLRYKLYFGDQSVGNPVTLTLDKSKTTDDIVVETEKSIRENIRKLK